MSAPAKERVRARARAKKKAKARGGHATIAVSKDTLHESVQLLKGKNWLPQQQWTQCNPGFIPKRWNCWRPGNSKGKSEGQTNLLEKEVCPSQNRKVCSTFHSWVASTPRSGSTIIGTRMKWTTTAKAIGQDDWLNCATSQFEQAAEQFHLVKKGKKGPLEQVGLPR